MMILRQADRGASRRAALAFVLFCLGSQSAMAQSSGFPAGPGVSRPRTVVVAVAGSAAWTDTGLDVSAGEMVSFEADGQITLQKGNPEAECGPDGYDLQTLQQPLTGRNLGALIGKVVIAMTVIVDERTKEERRQEAAEFFYVGSKGRVEMPAKGRLFLGINESVIGDNGGEFRVSVTASPEREARF